MKTNKTIIQFIGILILLFVIHAGLYACPKCNRDFYNELLGQRLNSLGGQELLEAIRNQQITGQPSAFVLPDYLKDAPIIKQSNTMDTINLTNINSNDSCPAVTQTSFSSYISIFIQFIFINQLKT